VEKFLPRFVEAMFAPNPGAEQVISDGNGPCTKGHVTVL